MLSLSVMFNSLQPHGLLLARLLCPWGFSRQKYWSGLPSSPSGDLPNPGIKPRSPSLQADSLPAYPQGKPKNTGVYSLFLLQQIFLTQESNRGLLYYRWIFYQLNYQGILQARILEWVAFPFSRGSFQPRDRTQVSRVAGGFSTI